MTSIEVPQEVVEQAQQHLFKYRRPLLAVPRPDDWKLVALPGDDARWGLMLDPGSGVGGLVVASGQHCHVEQDVILQRLFSYTVDVLADAPRKFTLGGKVVGMWGTEEGIVVLYGPIAVALLSWWCRRSKCGLAVVLDDEDG